MDQTRDGTPRQRKYRKRTVMSCVECYRRKQKCNRELPCNNCLSRRSAPRCRYEPKIDFRDGNKPSTTERVSEARIIAQPHAQSNTPHDAPGDHPEIISGDADPKNSIKGEGAETETDLLQSLGYMTTSSSTLFKDMEKFQKSPNKHKSPSALLKSHEMRQDIIKYIPKRAIIDFLVNYFIQEYYIWWTEPKHDTEEDIQFGLLILRLCLNSLQALPHPKYPTDELIKTSLDAFEHEIYTTACKIDSTPRPRVSSLTRLQQLFFHISYLKNAAEIQDSWFALGGAVKEAHEMGLHLKVMEPRFPEFEIEMRRRTFWSLYIWDRFMSTGLGRWPLIPEALCDLDLPQDTLQQMAHNPSPVTPFTDRILHIRIIRMMTVIMANPDWKTERDCAETVLKYAKHFEEEIIDRLPPVFRLVDPSKKWDDACLHLARKREHLRASIYSIYANIHRAFIDPHNKSACKGTAQLELAKTHQITLAKSHGECIVSILRLHDLLDGGLQRLFFVPMALIESAAVLGMCLLCTKPRVGRSDQFLVASSARWDRGLQQRLYHTFQDALALLSTLTEHTKIAQKGVKILKNIGAKVELKYGFMENSQAVQVVESGLDVPSTLVAAPPRDQRPMDPEAGPGELTDFSGDALTDSMRAIFEIDGWGELEGSAFAYSPDQSWFFNDDFLSTNV